MTFLWELAVELAGDLLIEVGVAAVVESLQRPTEARSWVAAIGVLILGALAGLLVVVVLPTRILSPGPVAGASLVVSPLVNGFAMERYGRWRERRGGARSSLATFRGGALFAFAMALVRFLNVAV